jgi:hypothetical protein
VSLYGVHRLVVHRAEGQVVMIRLTMTDRDGVEHL